MDLIHNDFVDKQQLAGAQALTCPICERQILPSTKFCNHCRAAILRRYCPGCNKLVPDAAHLCPYCGTPATAAPKLKTPYPMLAAWTGVFLVCLFVWLGISRHTEQPAQPPSPQVSTAPTQPAGNAPLLQRVTVSNKLPEPVQPAVPNALTGEQLNIEGHQLLKDKKLAEAVVTLRKATATLKDTGSPAYGYALFNLGQALRLSGNAQEAIPVLEEALKIMPDKALAENELSKARGPLTSQ